MRRFDIIADDNKAVEYRFQLSVIRRALIYETVIVYVTVMIDITVTS